MEKYVVDCKYKVYVTDKVAVITELFRHYQDGNGIRVYKGTPDQIILRKWYGGHKTVAAANLDDMELIYSDFASGAKPHIEAALGCSI